MPEVIGQDEKAAKKKTCKNCGAKLKYYPNEIKERHGTDYGGGPDGCKWIICPKCKDEVILESW